MNTCIRSEFVSRFVTLVSAVLIAIVACVSMQPAVFAADEAAPAATADKEKTDKDVSADKDKKKSDSEPAADSKKDAEADKTKDKESEKPAASSDAKPKASEDGKPKEETTAKTEKTESPKREKIRLAMLTLKSSMPESAGQVGPFGDVQLDLRETIKRLEKAAKDKSVSGLVLDIQNPDIGRGKIEELRGAIARFRASGKKVYATLDSAMPADYMVACACDEIVMPESGEIMLPGVRAEAMFYKGLLSKVGVEADFIHIGPYKSYAESMTRDSFSEPARENMNALVDSLYDEMITTIVKDRPMSIAQAKEVVDTGLITAKRAKELGLIDRVAYSDTLREDLAKKYEADPLVLVKNYGKKEVDTDFSGITGFAKLMTVMMGGNSSTSEGRGKKIAIVYAVGPISTGKSESDMFGDTTLGSTTIIEALRDANKDKNVVAIVLRIDSPGGSALASDLIWHETQVIKKPIVASMGDVAASGGYYIAMGADKIIAAPSTITGSIGVVGGKMALKGLYDKVGITTETIERGKNSGLFSASGKFTDSQREVLKKMMEDIYDQFTDKAAKGRKMPVDKLRDLAGGRVYTGRQAKEKGLVDELGTLNDAVVEAKKLAGLEADADVRIEVLPEPTNFFESLFGDMEAEKDTRISKGIESLAPEMVNIARRAARLRKAFDQPAAFVMPFDLDIK
jgi:protease IV